MMMTMRNTPALFLATATLLSWSPSPTLALDFDYCCKDACGLADFTATDRCFPAAAMDRIAAGMTTNVASAANCLAFRVDEDTIPSLGDRVLVGMPCDDDTKCCFVDEDAVGTCDNLVTSTTSCLPIGQSVDAVGACNFIELNQCAVPAPAPSFNYCCKGACTMFNQKAGRCIPLSVAETIADGINENFMTQQSCDATPAITFIPSGWKKPRYCAGKCCVLESCGDASSSPACLALDPQLDAGEACDYIGLEKCTFCDEDSGAGCSMDPHFVTWPNAKLGGERTKFDFHGQCDMIFAQVPNFAEQRGMTIQIRTTKRYKYSYIESAALQIGADVFQLDSFGAYAFNGISNADLEQVVLADRYPVAYRRPSDNQHLFDVQLSPDEHIMLSTYKDMVNVKFVNASSYFFHDSLGMMGHFETGEMRARDGKTIISDPDAFGQEWQVLESEPSLFLVTDRFPQHPVGCQMPEATSVTRRLGSTIAEKAAKEACAHWGENKDSCVYDVMATGDIDLAQASVF